jgi:predicted nuclease of restriction endonuclease-like (RecB) superfamily
MPHAYTEDQLVEQPAIGLFAGLGWALAGSPPNAGVAGETVMVQQAAAPLAKTIKSAPTRVPQPDAQMARGQSAITPAPLAQLSKTVPLIVQRPVAQLPWVHHTVLLNKLTSSDDRLWYAAQAMAFGWSRDVLALQIDSALHLRQGQAVSNFQKTLPPPQSDLAQQITKDPYLILCRSQNRVIAEYALRDLNKPIGISGYVTKLMASLPKTLKGAVPSVAELEKGLAGD